MSRLTSPSNWPLGSSPRRLVGGLCFLPIASPCGTQSYRLIAPQGWIPPLIIPRVGPRSSWGFRLDSLGSSVPSSSSRVTFSFAFRCWCPLGRQWDPRLPHRSSSASAVFLDAHSPVRGRCRRLGCVFLSNPFLTLQYWLRFYCIVTLRLETFHPTVSPCQLLAMLHSNLNSNPLRPPMYFCLICSLLWLSLRNTHLPTYSPPPFRQKIVSTVN